MYPLQASRPLAAPFTEAIAGWDTTFGKERAGRREVTRAEAVVAVQNRLVDDETRRFGGILLVEAGGDHAASVFQRFFPLPVSTCVAQHLRKQCERTVNFFIAELGKPGENSPLRPFATSLEGLARAALEALDRRAAAKGARSVANSGVDKWKEGVNQLRLTTYSALLKLASDHHLPRPKAWAETFFRQESRREAETEEPTTPPTGGE